MRFGIPLKRIKHNVFHSPKHKKISSFFPLIILWHMQVSSRYYLTFKTKTLAESYSRLYFELKIKEFGLKNANFGRWQAKLLSSRYFCLLKFCVRMRFFVVTVWGHGKRFVIFQLESFTISSKKFLNENLGLCMHTIVVVETIFRISPQIIRTVSTMVKSFGENILWKFVQWKNHMIIQSYNYIPKTKIWQSTILAIRYKSM